MLFSAATQIKRTSPPKCKATFLIKQPLAHTHSKSRCSLHPRPKTSLPTPPTLLTLEAREVRTPWFLRGHTVAPGIRILTRQQRHCNPVPAQLGPWVCILPLLVVEGCTGSTILPRPRDLPSRQLLATRGRMGPTFSSSTFPITLRTSICSNSLILMVPSLVYGSWWRRTLVEAAGLVSCRTTLPNRPLWRSRS